MIIAAVVGGAAWDDIGEFLAPDQIATPNFEPIDPKAVCNLVDGALDGKIGRRLAETAHGLLHGLVGGHRDGAVLHAADAIGPDDGADRLAELERRAAGIGAHIVEGAHFHGMDHAGIVEGDLDVE